MSVYRPAKEIAADLAKKYDGPTKQVRGSGNQMYTYIPWNVTLRKLEEVFGPFGYDIRIVSSESHPKEGVYVSVVEVTGRGVDENGQVVSLTRTGQGRSVAQPSKWEREEKGYEVSRNLSIHKTAAAGAASDALSRAAKQLGDGFGLFLYDKDDDAEQDEDERPARRSSYGGGKSSSSGAKRGGPTDNQRKWLRKNGFDDDEIDDMSFEQASSELDRIFNKDKKGGSSKSRKPVAAGSRGRSDDDDEDVEDIPF